jgi:hypothetical protein
MNTATVEVNFFGTASDGRTTLERRESKLVGLHGRSSQGVSLQVARDWEVRVEATPMAGVEGSPAPKLRGTRIAAEFKLSPSASKPALNCSVSISFTLAPPPGGAAQYVLIPATLYNGNRGKSRRAAYSPRIPEDLATPHCASPVMNDVFRLLGDDPGVTRARVQVLARDTTFPLVAAPGFIAELPVESSTDSLEVAEDRSSGAELVVRFATPGVREETTYWVTHQATLSEDVGADVQPGGALRLEVLVHTFDDAASPRAIVAAAFGRRCEIDRQARAARGGRRNLCFPLSAALDAMETKWNGDWNEALGMFPTSERETDVYYWQAGWCGGLMKLPLLLCGSQLSKERALRELGVFFDKAPVESSGLFLALARPDGASAPPAPKFSTEYEWDTRGGAAHFKNWTLVRRQADIVYFLQRQLALLTRPSVPAEWWAAIDAACDAFVRAFRSCGQLGFFLDATTGLVACGNSTGAALVPASLVLAHRRHPGRGYLQAAKDICRQLTTDFLDKGFTCGGPGDAMHAPDSESSALLLESLVTLFEEAADPAHLDDAEDCARLFSTWVYPYNFKYPADSSLGRAACDSKGAVWANVQNRHGAPGICTHSGSFLLRLYRATGKQVYLDLLADIAIALPQFVSRADRPLSVSTAEAGGGRRDNPVGWINERVNSSRWDSANVGGVKASSSAWCEVALALTAMELPSVYVDRDSGTATVLDHVECVAGDGAGEMTLRNPTAYDASVWVLAETGAQRKVPLVDGYFLGVARHVVPAGSSLKIAY